MKNIILTISVALALFVFFLLVISPEKDSAGNYKSFTEILTD